MDTRNLPLGYWIKKVDNLLTAGIDRIQANHGLTRTEWQVLNCIAGSHHLSKTEIITIIAPFAHEKAAISILDKLERELLISQKDENIVITPTGTELNHSCLKEQLQFRKKAMNDVSEQQYQTTVYTLEKIAENLSRNVINTVQNS